MSQTQQQQTEAKQKQQGLSELAKREERTARWLLLPTFAVILLIAIYPLGQVFVSSFTNARFAAPDHQTQFIGFQNYSNLLSMTIRELPVETDDEGNPVIEDGEVQYENSFRVLPSDPRRYRGVYEFSLFGNRYVLGATNQNFVRSIWDTVSLTVIAVFLETVLGMAIALTLSVKFLGRGVMRAAMLVPWAVITVVSARIWEWMLEPTRAGFFNAFFDQIGIASGNISFFTNPALQIPSMIAMEVWKTTPFMALLLLAGLATIPKELYEAAEVDGATPIRRFFSITLPLVAPTLAVALIFRTLDSLRIFDAFQVVLGEQRYSMASFAQSMLINNSDVGLSSAASVIIFIIVFSFAILYMRALGVDTE
ncbi:MAG: sugar ABC transporter permease [Trueperaceae bacterium]|nr:sugar ABC transporter permease [Trueperaceae bacterium]